MAAIIAAAGIVCAANIDADVINMSFGSSPPMSQRGFLSDIDTADPSDDEQGTTISPGNDAIDFDRTADLIVLPAMAPHFIAVSALAPEGWCANRSTDLGVAASYTNFGQSVIDFAAPGGDFDFPQTFDSTVVNARGVLTTRPVWGWPRTHFAGSGRPGRWSRGASSA